jgi:hypothetical protein
MEDVIDEFVEEINEEEMLEQEQQQQQQLEESRRSSKRKKNTETETENLSEKRLKKKRKEESVETNVKKVYKRKKKVETTESVSDVQPEKPEIKLTETDLSETSSIKQLASEDQEISKDLQVEALAEKVPSDISKKKKRKVGRKKKGRKGQKKKQTVESQKVEGMTEAQTEKIETRPETMEEEEEENISKIEEFLKSHPSENSSNVKETRGRKRKQVEGEEILNLSNQIQGNEEQTDEPTRERTEGGETVEPNNKTAETEEVGEAPTNKRGRKRGRKSKKSKVVPEEVTQNPDEVPASNEVTEIVRQNPMSSFKPISDWKKVLKYPQNYSDLSTKLIEKQLFKNPLPPYVPCVPRNTSKRLIENLTEKELEQLCCPGCKDRFLIPSTFFQHLYRKSVRISFNCRPCGNLTLSFYNRCHLRTHVLSHLEVDGTSSVTISDSDSLSIIPLEQSEFNIGFVDESYTEELDTVHREHFRTSNVEQNSSLQCTECRLTLNKDSLPSHFHESKKSNSNFFECPDCKMNLPNQCSLAAHQRIHKKLAPFVCPGKYIIFVFNAEF